MSILCVGEIKSVHFYITGSAENKIDGFVGVKYKDAYKSGNIPYEEGIHDARMGTYDNAWICASCGNKKDLCPGHAGYLELRYPVQSPMFKDEIFKWLKIICISCGELKVSKDLSANASNTLMREHMKLVRPPTKGKKKNLCHSCGAEHPNIVRDKTKPLAIYKEWDGEDRIHREQIMNREIAIMLDRITPETLSKVGRNMDSHPRKFILSTLNVPANTMRPDMKRTGGGKSSANDTTILLKTIVAANNDLPIEITEYTSDIIVSIENLDLAVFEMIKGSSATSKKTKMTHSSGKPITSIASHLPKKTGRVRGTMQGKRTHNCCRSVISGDPAIEIDEIGVPIAIAKKIQIPIIVHSWNNKELLVYFSNKDTNYPGCTKIKKKSTGKTHYVGAVREDFRLEEGDIIWRDLINGDVLAFNRAPSLLPSNISCHRVRIHYIGSTLACNVLACNLYNADFDGDEMNCHIPLTITTQVEIKNLMSVGERMISYQHGSPVVGSFQDSLIGGALLTRSGQTFDKYHTMRLFSEVNLREFRNLTFGKKQYTNYEIVSMILPNINFQGSPKCYVKGLAHIIKYNKNDIKVLIDSGVHKSGILDTKAVGQSTSGSLAHIIKNQYGSRAALDFIYTLQQIITVYLLDRGFSLGIKDMLISKKALAQVHQKTSAILQDSQRITDRLNAGEIIPPIGMSTEEYYEVLQQKVLEIADDFLQIILSDINPAENQLYQLIATGSKGNTGNLLMISSSIGQQYINGSRMKYTFGYNRTLPYFSSFDTNPESRGFIPDSYIAGLGLASFIFASMDARFALIKKALSTSITGAQNRTSIKNLESAVVNNLQACTKANRIVQPIYGESGLDPRSVEILYLPTVNISDNAFAEYHIKISQIDKKYRNKSVESLLHDEFAQLKDDRNLYREIMLKIEDQSGINNRLYGNKIKTPMNMKRLLNDTIFRYGKIKGTLNPPEAIKKIMTLCEDLPYVAFNEDQRKSKAQVPSYWQAAMLFARIMIRAYLNIKTLLELKISDMMLDIIIDQIWTIYSSAFMAYGTAVGIIAAQSLSEPLTQFVLDSHHRSGGGGTKTETLVRAAEILGARSTEKMKNPAMFIQVREDIEMDEAKVQEVANHIEMMSVGRFITHGIALFYERFGDPIYKSTKHESAMIKEFLRNNPANKPPGDLLPYCIRFELDRKELILKNMPLEQLIEAIQLKFPLSYLVYSPENADELIVRIYVRTEAIKKGDVRVAFNDLIIKIEETVIRGIEGIILTEVVKRQIPRTYIAPDGSIQTKKIYAIQTIGTNLPGVLAHPMVDPYHVQSDSIIEIAEIYGIEAAREKILNELKTIDSQTMESGPAHQHYTIYADEMTSTGYVTSIERTGLSKREVENVMLKISTASPIQVIEDAALKGMTDHLDGVSALLMVGQTPLFGSSYNSLTIDEDFVKKNTTSVKDVLDGL